MSLEEGEFINQRQNETNNINKIGNKDSAPFLIKQLKFFGAMCMSRNYSWKSFLEDEGILTLNALLNSFTMDYSHIDMNAVLCYLINNIYLDCKQMNLQILPQYCKKFKINFNKSKNFDEGSSMEESQNDLSCDKSTLLFRINPDDKSGIDSISRGHYNKTLGKKDNRQMEKGNIHKVQDSLSSCDEFVEDELNSDLIKSNLLRYIKKMEDKIIKLNKISKYESEENFKSSENTYSEIYNEYTLQIMKMINTLFRFGHFTFNFKNIDKHSLPKFQAIRNQDNDSQILSNYLPCMIDLLQFDKVYPEMTTLIDKIIKASEKKIGVTKNIKKISNFMSGIWFGMPDSQKIKSGIEEDEDFSQSKYDSYREILKQSKIQEILILNVLNLKETEIEDKIKIEILNVLDYILDYCIDYHLTMIKNRFETFLSSKELQSYYLNDNFIELDGRIDTFILDILKECLPLVAETGTSIDDTNQEIKMTIKEKKKGSFYINKLTNKKLFPPLIALFINSSHCSELKNLSLEVLCKIYSLRTRILDGMIKVLPVFDHKIEDFEIIKNKLEVLANYCQESETWFESDDENEYNRAIEKLQSIMVLFCNAISKKQQSPIFKLKYSSLQPNTQKSSHTSTRDRKSLRNKELFDFNLKDTASCFLEEEPEMQDDVLQRIKEVQIIFRNLDAHNTVIDFLRDSLYLLNENKGRAFDPNFIKFIKSCFEFLRLFCTGNKENQILLSNYFSVFLQEIPTDMGQVSLFIEIFKNNEYLCENKYLLIADDFIKWIKMMGKQSIFLDFFLIILKDENKNFIRKNQHSLIDMLLDHEDIETLLYCKFFKEKKIKQNVNNDNKDNDRQKQTVENDKVQRNKLLADQEDEVFNFVFDKDDNIDNEYYLDEPVLYHAKIIEILHDCCYETSGLYLVKRKVQSLLNLDYLLDILMQNDCFTLNYPYQGLTSIPKIIDDNLGGTRQNQVLTLKYRVLQFVNHVYAENERSHSQLVEVLPKLKSFIDCEGDRMIKIESPRPEYKAYLLEQILPLIKSMLVIFRDDIDKESKQNNKLQSHIVETGQMVDQIVKYKSSDKKQLIESYKEDDSRNQISIDWRGEDLKEFFKIWMENFILFATKNLKSDKLSIKAQKVIEKIFNLLPEIPIEKKSILSRYKDLENRKIVEEDEVSSQSEDMENKDKVHKIKTHYYPKYCWTKMINKLKDNTEAKKMAEGEKLVLSEAIRGIESTLESTIGSLKAKELKKYSYVTRLLSKSSVISDLIQLVQNNFDIKEMNTTLRNVLEILKSLIPTREQSAKQINQHDENFNKEVVKEQNFLMDCGASTMIMTNLCSEEVSLDNSDYTTSLFDFIKIYLFGGNKQVQISLYHYIKTTSNSEVFFTKLHRLFVSKMDVIKKKQNIDKMNIQALIEILRIIQLFVEGHYEPLQLYLRVQTNSHHSYDILKDVVELLESCIKYKLNHYYELIRQCLDTITEMIQGPCEPNRVSLIGGTFFETASKILEIQDYVENCYPSSYYSENIYLEPWQFAKIKYRCSIVLLSLVESRRDSEVLSKIQNSLKIESLVTNIVDTYLYFQ